MSPKPWQLVSSKQDRDYRIFNLRTDLAISPRTGKEHHFFIIESFPWVNVIPLTPQNEVVLVKQYRHGTQNVTLEIPNLRIYPFGLPVNLHRLCKRTLEEFLGSLSNAA